MNDTLTSLAKRSSTRGFTAEKLTPQELDALLLAGLQAPTAANRQEIHFTVMDGESPLLAELHQDLIRGNDRANPAHNFFYEAPTVVILSGPEDFPWSPVDAGIAVENMAVAAQSMGLGSLIIGCVRGVLTGERAAYYQEQLRLPQGNVYQVAIALGHPAVFKEPHEVDRAKNVTVL